MYDYILQGDCRETLKELPDKSVDCCVTSPPYYGLRDYGTGTWVGGDPSCEHKGTPIRTREHINENYGQGWSDVKNKLVLQPFKTVCPLCGAVREDKQIGLEETPEEYIDRLVDVFREVKRVLNDDGTLWLNIGDSYNSTHTGSVSSEKQLSNNGSLANMHTKRIVGGCKPKDLIGIPWMLAFALRNDGWYLRQDIIWCLSGGTYLYVKSQKGVQPMMLKDAVRLDPKTVKLWDGNDWVNVLGWSRSNDTSEKIELVLRSGETIGCTGNHKWVLSDGTEKRANELNIGDVLKTTVFSDENTHVPYILTKDILWLIGLYIAEGSRSEDTIQISLNANEQKWIARINAAIIQVGGTMAFTVSGNNLNIRLSSKVFNGILNQYVGGRTAKNKHLNNICWQMPNSYIKEILKGYFDGDGHYDGDRIRLGFARNCLLERDLRLAAARLGATLTLNKSFAMLNGKRYPSFRGEWRWVRSGHRNEKARSEIVEIRNGRARHYYDVSVGCDNHLFALSSGVMTHNCKPNPMPESIKDRCTKSHEYIFLLSKNQRYYFDHEAIQEQAVGNDRPRVFGAKDQTGTNRHNIGNVFRPKHKNLQYNCQQNHTMHERRADGLPDIKYSVRNKRDVWNVPVAPVKEAHFATFPEKLIEPCILAGCPIGGVVLDPFFGSGTTGRVAVRLNRHYIGCELNPEYIEIANRRTDNVQLSFEGLI